MENILTNCKALKLNDNYFGDQNSNLSLIIATFEGKVSFIFD